MLRRKFSSITTYVGKNMWSHFEIAYNGVVSSVIQFTIPLNKVEDIFQNIVDFVVHDVSVDYLNNMVIIHVHTKGLSLIHI